MARHKVDSSANVVNVQECTDSIECNFDFQKNWLNVMIVVNVASSMIPKSSQFIHTLYSDSYECKCIYVNFNKRMLGIYSMYQVTQMLDND